MSCECVDPENGELLDRCLGVCKPAKKLIQFQEHALTVENRIIDLIHSIKNEINREKDRIWIDAFRQGFEMAREIYE